jgi:CheY-like chemotaxis protein
MTPPTRQNNGTTPVNRRILVVDDNPAIHSDIRKILCPRRTEDTSVNDLEGILFDEAPKTHATLTFELFSAHQGQEALEMVRRSLQEGQPYALAFMDVRMPPGWDGIETISRIWEIDPSIQMVVCTAYSDYSWEEMRSRLGQPESLVVLKKPFDNVEVQQLAHALTRKWQLNVQAESATSQLEGVVDYMRSFSTGRSASLPCPYPNPATSVTPDPPAPLTPRTPTPILPPFPFPPRFARGRTATGRTTPDSRCPTYCSTSRAPSRAPSANCGDGNATRSGRENGLSRPPQRRHHA